VVKPRSHCVRCRKPIAWYDNIPVVSYVVLGGRCRYCRRHISLRYPTVELMTGLLWCWFVVKFGVTPTAAKMCVFTAILTALAFSDLEKRLLPDQLTKGGMLVGFAFSLFVPVSDYVAHGVLFLMKEGLGFDLGLGDTAYSVAESLLGAGAPALLLWGGATLWGKMRGREMLGFGDVKLIAMVGAFLGLTGAMLTMLIGSIAGSIVGLLYIKATKQKMSEYELPFGTFLGFAGIAVALMGSKWLGMP
jgi:leader peptidase (prepilin peptidase)/N-methyltransferase